MSENLQTSSVTWVWKPDVDNNVQVVQIAQMLSQISQVFISKSNVWKLAIHTDGFGRRYVTLEITLPPLSSTDETEKSGSLSSEPRTSSGLSDLFYPGTTIRKKDRSTHEVHKILDVCPGDDQPCYAYKDKEEAHWRCGTIQCGGVKNDTRSS